MVAVLAAGGLTLFNPRALAHTLPISYVFVVADQDYVHLELSFNPFELTSFTGFDTNHNGRLDPEELGSTQEKLTHLILEHLVLSANGKPVAAETAGIAPDADSHHATLRAHYRVDARRAGLTLESSLQAITSSSHLTQVNFLRDGKPQLAQLDSQSRKVTFAAPTRAVAVSAPPDGRPAATPASGRGVKIALGAAFALVLFGALRQGETRRTRDETQESFSHQPTPNFMNVKTCLLTCCTLTPLVALAAEPLWSIGKPDGVSIEFAPGGKAALTFTVGQSVVSRDFAGHQDGSVGFDGKVAEKPYTIAVRFARAGRGALRTRARFDFHHRRAPAVQGEGQRQDGHLPDSRRAQAHDVG